MRAAARRVRRELSKALDDPSSADWKAVAQRCLLWLALPKRKVRARDSIRGARKVTLRELDDLARRVVFARDHSETRLCPACRRCRSEERLQWAHVYSRRYRTVRHDPLNSMVLCAGCHLWWHHNPTEAVDWWQAQVGRDAAHDLERRKLSAKPPRPELVKIFLLQEAKKYGVVPEEAK